MIWICRCYGIARKWLLVSLLSYFLLGLVYMAGFNPKGCVQDTFIVRVYLIPGFALWGVFIGLGMVIIARKIENIVQEGSPSASRNKKNSDIEVETAK